MTERKGVWFGFQLAAEEVERRLGLTWGAAQKTLIEACKNGKIETRSNYSGQGPDVFDMSVVRDFETGGGLNQRSLAHHG